MKKSFYFLGVILIACGLLFAACEKDDNQNNNNSNDTTSTGTPTDTTGGGNNGNTTTFNEWTLDANGNVVANGNGTLTINGVEHCIGIAHLSEYTISGSSYAVLSIYDSYSINQSTYTYTPGNIIINLNFPTTHADAGSYACGEGNDQVDVKVSINDTTYVFPNGLAFELSRTGNNISLSMSQDNVQGINVGGQVIATANISFTYSGSTYHQSFNY